MPVKLHIRLMFITLSVLPCTRAALAYVDCYAWDTVYGTGWTDGIGKQDGTIVVSNVGPERGWMYFDLRNLPMSPRSYSIVELHYYQTADTNYPTLGLRWADGAIPSQDPDVLFDALDEGFSLGDEGASFGWHVDTLPSWNLWPGLPDQSLMVSFVGPEGIPPPRHVAVNAGRLEATHEPYLRFIP